MNLHKSEIPLILAIESSAASCSVALAYSSELLAEYSFHKKNFHDRFLSEFCRRILQDFSISMANIDAVAVSAGPGSFTGLRIGVSLAKALCFGTMSKLLGVPTLSAMAFHAKNIAEKCNSNEIIAALPSHKNLIYCQRFSPEAEPISEIQLVEIQQFQEIADKPEIFLAGKTDTKCTNCFNLDEMNLPTAKMIALFGYELFKNSEFSDPDTFLPIYVQDFIPK